MHIAVKAPAGSLIAVAAMLLCGPAFAQEAPSSDARESAGIADIIVTAQKRSQSLQDVSASVTALDSDRLVEAHVSTIEDLQVLVPTVTFGADFNIAKIFIRGVGQNTSTSGSEPAVALHVDGAVVARPEAQLTALFDLERVEVLRGPQGTLYGRNATGGSINLITTKPTRDFTGYANVIYGNYNAFVVEGAVSGPLSDTLSARIAFRSQDRDGFGRNPVTGGDVDGQNRYMGRAHLLYEPSDRFNFLLTGEFYRQNDSSGAILFHRESFPGVARLPSLGVGGYAARERDLASEFDTGTKTRTWAVTGTATFDLSDAVTLVNITNYRDFDTVIQQDLDVSAVVESLATNGKSTTIQRRFTRSNQFTNEFQVQVDTPFVDGVLGLFYFHERQRPADTIGLTPIGGQQSNIAVLEAARVDLEEAYALCQMSGNVNDIDGQPLAPKRVCLESNLGTEAYAAFGQALVNLGALSPTLETVTLKLGGRFSHETRDSRNPAIIIARGGLGPVIRMTSEGTFRERTFKDFTPEAGLEWKPSSDLLVYYAYSEGFKSGAGENAAGSTTIVGPETIKNHEAGIKATLLDRRLAVNVSAFSYKLRGLQISKTINDPVAGFVTRFENAARTEAKGIELELFAQPLPKLRLNGSVAYLDSEFKDFTTADPLDPRNVSTPPNLPAYDPVTNPTGFSPVIIQLAGNPTRNSPKWAWNVHGEFDLPLALPADGALTLSGDVSYKGKTYFTEFARLLEGARSYTTGDASLTYRTGDERFRASLWVKNMGDVFRPSSTFALSTARVVGVTHMPPRTYGATIGYRF